MYDETTAWNVSRWIRLEPGTNLVTFEYVAASADGAEDGYATVWVNNVQVSGLQGLDTDAKRVDKMMIGNPRAAYVGSTGSFYIDDVKTFTVAP